jgi:peptidoglycan/LPS O-acetylase OafA/YrhL
VAIGDMSYSVYLTHFLIIGVVCRVIIDNEVVSLFNTGLVLCAILMALAVSKIVYEIFEVRLAGKLKKINMFEKDSRFK